MRIVQPNIGASCCDHLGPVTPAQALALREDGFTGVFLYTQALTAATLQACLDAGLWVGFVTEGLAPTTQPTRELGQTMGVRASETLRACQVPRGVTVFVDLESANGAWPATDWIAFAAGAGFATLGQGDTPGAYVAEGTGMTRDDLTKLPAQRYWRGAARILDRYSNPVDEPGPGWCVVQGCPINIAHRSGMSIDVDVTWADREGRRIQVVAA